MAGFDRAVVSLQAQVPDQIRQATISGSRGTSGKCTTEVRVDMAAEVDVYENSGRMRTIAGNPPRGAALACTDPLPYDMSDFLFNGIDGRGQVKLAQDPRNNNGIAVIRIDDPKSGSEGYSFDIKWSGASGGAPTEGFQAGVNNPATRRNNRTASTGGYFPGRDQAGPSQQSVPLTCAARKCAREPSATTSFATSISPPPPLTQLRDEAIGSPVTSATGRQFPPYGGYRFNCAMAYNSGLVRTIETLRGDGTALQPPGFISGAAGKSLQPERVPSEPDRSCLPRRRGGPDGPRRLSKRELRFHRRRHQPQRMYAALLLQPGSRMPDTFAFGCSMGFSKATAAIWNEAAVVSPQQGRQLASRVKEE